MKPTTPSASAGPQAEAVREALMAALVEHDYKRTQQVMLTEPRWVGQARRALSTPSASASASAEAASRALSAVVEFVGKQEPDKLPDELLYGMLEVETMCRHALALYAHPQQQQADGRAPDPFEGLDERLDRLLLTASDNSRFVLSTESAKNIVGIVREWLRPKSGAVSADGRGATEINIEGIIGDCVSIDALPWKNDDGSPALLNRIIGIHEAANQIRAALQQSDGPAK